MAKRVSKIVAPRSSQPDRRTGSTYRVITSYPGNRPSNQIARIDPNDHYSRSQLNNERIPRKLLRAFADTLPAQTAIKRIVDGVTQMPFAINPPKEDKVKESAQEQALKIERALRHPNSIEQKTWGQFIATVVNELLVMGACPIERQQSTQKTADQQFWMWPCNSDSIVINPTWTPQTAGMVPRYYDISLGIGDKARIELLDAEMFMLQHRCNTWQITPPSPLETAFKMISAWLGVTEYQANTTSHISQEVLLFIGEVSERQYSAFKEWWQNDVQGTGEIPILAGKGKPEAIKIGANNDSGLYLEYTDQLLKMISLAFLLRPQDVNIEKETNFATAGISADASFQFAMVPTAKSIIDSLQVEIIDRYYPGFTIELSDMEKRSEMDEANIANILYAGNLSTQNEGRLRVGLPSLGNVGEHFFDGFTADEIPMKRQQIDEQEEDKANGVNQPVPNGKFPPKPGIGATKPVKPGVPPVKVTPQDSKPKDGKKREAVKVAANLLP